MWCCTSNNFATGITVSIWTVVQTSFHIIWALCGYYFYICKIKPRHYVLVILYLTYFYKHDCGNITLDDEDNVLITKKTKTNIIPLDTNVTDDEDVYDIIQTILEKAVLPKESNAAWRTHLYLNVFIISDAVWIISAFLLFAGTCFQIRRCLSLLFYCPWLIVTACVILLDVVSAVHFGLDIMKVHNITTWLKFIGVQNYDDFSNFNDHQLSRLVTTIPAISLCVLFSRMLVIWIFNIVHFFQIMHVAVLAFQDNLDGRNLLQQQKTGVKISKPGDLNLDTSAARIRNWQLFYGATDTTNTDESSSSSKSSERDCNSNRSIDRPSKGSIKIIPPMGRSEDSLDSYGRYISSIRDESTRSRGNVSTYYQRYPDVADDIDNSNNKTVSVVGSLRSQMPWSYFPTHIEEKSGRELDVNVIVNEYGHYRLPKNPYVNDRASCTEL